MTGPGLEPPRRLQRRQALAWLVGVSGNLCAGCSSSEGTPTGLTRSLTTAAHAAAPGETLDLERVVAQDWDTVILIGPYTPVPMIEKAIGGAAPRAVTRLSIEERDDINVLVFLLAGKVAAAVALPRSAADFNRADLLRPLDRQRAHLVRSSSGVVFRVISRSERPVGRGG